MKERGRERLADVMRRGEGVRRLALPLLPSALTAALGSSQANTNSFFSRSPALCHCKYISLLLSACRFQPRSPLDSALHLRQQENI